MSRSLISLVLVVAACGASGLPSSGDGGAPGVDLAHAGGDLAPSCDTIAAEVGAWIDQHQSCRADSDCTRVDTDCGLPGQCGAIASGPVAGLTSLVGEWQGAGCKGPCPPCALLQGRPVCMAGACVLGPPGAIGDACTSGIECMGGSCLGPSAEWPSGYCTQTFCEGGCPMGSSCRTIAENETACLKECDPASKMSDCRAGYACCSGPGPTGNPSWCYADNSAACLSQ